MKEWKYIWWTPEDFKPMQKCVKCDIEKDINEFDIDYNRGQIAIICSICKKSTEKIDFKGKFYALIMRKEHEPEKTEFYTDKDNPLQMGIITHEKGYIEKPHIHKPVKRIITETQETLTVTKGIVKINFYDKEWKKFGERTLREGDTILLSANGGHAIEVLENFKGIKVKQGPYISVEKDKEIFTEKK